MAKITTRNTGLSTLAEYEQCLDKIADLTVKRDKAQAQLDKAILAAREEYGGVIKGLNNQIAVKLAQAEQYATRNRENLLQGDAKSGETGKARWGWRLGNPTLVLLSRKFTWGAACARIREMGLTSYLKVSDPKPDKDKLKAELDDERLASLGLRIEQTEAYWVEPKTDTGERISA